MRSVENWCATVCAAVVLTAAAAAQTRASDERTADERAGRELTALLQSYGFTGQVESTLAQRLGRPIDAARSDLGRLLFFDPIMSLHNDNNCSGCHAPNFGMGDSGSIAIGIDSNQIVGANRIGPRNQRRTPTVINTAFVPALMWNGRFFAPGGDPFDNSLGFTFPFPEGTTRFPAGDPRFPTLLSAQAHIPPTELTEVAGFSGTAGTIGPLFDQFDDGHGQALPPVDDTGTRNEPIRDAALKRLNASQAYLDLFGMIFNDGIPLPPGAIDFTMVGQAIAEFEFSLTFMDAPLDRFARGDSGALTASQKRGGVLFFGKARCIECHSVGGASNEMFSDFVNHVIGVPQIAPAFGIGLGNVLFDGPGADEDFGAEQISGNPDDRYKFRTAPLRNLAVLPAFMHNGAFAHLEDAIRHHLDAAKSARRYDPVAGGVDSDIQHVGPIEPVLARLDEKLQRPVHLTNREFADLVNFVRDGLTDDRARPENLCSLIPDSLPSALPILTFEGCN